MRRTLTVSAVLAGSFVLLAVGDGMGAWVMALLVAGQACLVGVLGIVRAASEARGRPAGTVLADGVVRGGWLFGPAGLVVAVEAWRRQAALQAAWDPYVVCTTSCFAPDVVDPWVMAVVALGWTSTLVAAVALLGVMVHRIACVSHRVPGLVRLAPQQHMPVPPAWSQHRVVGSTAVAVRRA